MGPGLKGFRSGPQASCAYAFGFCLNKKKGRVEPFIRRKFNRWDDNKADNSVKPFFRLAFPTGTFAILFPGEKQACGPGKQNAECALNHVRFRAALHST